MQGVTGNAGITVVTPLVSATDTRPIVPAPLNDSLSSAPTGSLVGGFTLADTSTNSAFGQNPLGRVAVDASGHRAPAGAIVDGTTIRYQRIAPDALVIPFYFNPNGGTPLANRAILAAFEDCYAASGFSSGPVSVNLASATIDASGNDIGSGTLPVSGVTFTDVQSLAGATPLASSGKVVLGLTAPLPANANLLGLMSQSLGTFAVGQGMPGYFAAQPDWRLPTIVELQTILLAPSPCETSPCIDPVFGPTVANPYWSATTGPDNVNAWGVDFSQGTVAGTFKSDGNYARAVRAGS